MNKKPVYSVYASSSTPLSQDAYLIEVVKQATDIVEDKLTSKKQAIRIRNHLSHLTATVGRLDEFIAQGQGDVSSLRDLFSNVLIRSFLIGCGIDGGKVEQFNETLDARKSGGVASGEARRLKAEAWRVHAADLMREIRAEYHDWSREKVAIEVLSRWRLRDVEPPASVRTLVTLLEKLEADGTIAARKNLKRTSSFPKRTSSLLK